MSTLHKEIDYKVVFQSMPGVDLLLLPDSPNFTIVEVSNQFLLSTKWERANIVGKKLFEAYPDVFANPDASGVKNFRYSLEQVIATRKPDRISTRYDVENKTGILKEFYWGSCKYTGY